jgi:hypothetical protein
MNRRFAAGAALSTALVLSLTGCLGESGSGGGAAGEGVQLTAAQVLQKASEKTSQTKSFAADLSAQGTEDGEAVQMRGSMSFQAEPPAFRMAFDSMSVGGEEIPGGMQMVVVNRALYMKMPFLTQVTGGKPWMKFSARDLAAGGSDIKELTQQGDQFNLQLLTKMLTASKDAKAVGAENVGGVQTTHFTGTFSGQDALTALTPEERKQAKNILDTDGERLAFDLWVDDQQLPRKLTLKSLPGAKDQMTMTMVFRDYSKPVQITPPPADQVGKAPRQVFSGT